MSDFSKEIALLQNLRHPHVVLFLGVTCHESGLGIGIVTELCKKGSLDDLIHRTTLEWHQLIKILAGITLGMGYLHSSNPPIVHRDLKPANILLLEDFTPKVCDFGISQFVVSEKTRSSLTTVGSPPWVPPEVIRGESFGPAVDIYAFGMIMWEILTRTRPYQTMYNHEVLFEYVLSGGRPEIPNWCPYTYAQLMRQCWEEDPQRRPSSFWKITKILQKDCLPDGFDEQLPEPQQLRVSTDYSLNDIFVTV
eukprot:CAMPEP_0174272386 /NCGR_PEP_ID=MMETSP0439-20130205/51061_1 /TAXON_ID=0 /ORGANISM="Stereomyxa ramosa, Strain Chinc5" /LENGTH=250 /DNA_ID=CAMNT_0015362911 /DNA_START=1 /DNA_END=753 /DNA_ORIENTATION=+